jgi:hypothetical protein
MNFSQNWMIFPKKNNEYANIGLFSPTPNGFQIGFQTNLRIKPKIPTQMRIGLLKINYLIYFYFLKFRSIL